MSHENKKKGHIIGIKEMKQQHDGLDVDLWQKVNRAFPVRVTRSWYNRMKSFDGPLANQVLPHDSELEDDPRGLTDPVGEKKLAPVPWVISKHSDRALLLVSKRCHLYCRYCFRRNHDGAKEPTDQELENALSFIAQNNFEEVILSGGDPLILSDTKLDFILSKIVAPVVRVHTRAPITAPYRVTERLCQVLSQIPGLWVIVHVNHPDELSADVIRGLRIF